MLNRAKLYASLVKLEHTVFALPFCLSAAILSQGPGHWPEGVTLGWILLAMGGGRTYAMALNRLADAAIDARNPRTASREIPAGKVKTREVWGLMAVALSLMVGATAQLPPVCLQWLPLAVILLTGYSFTKRFTSLCHLWLGLTLGSAAIAGWLATVGHWSLGLPLWLGVAVMGWSAGFDILYACQDVDFDRANGLHSIPAKLGVARALWVSRLLHGVTVISLIGFGWQYGRFFEDWGPWGYWSGTALMAGMLVYEQSLVKADDLSRVNAAFFTVNGVAALVFLACVALGHWLGS